MRMMLRILPQQPCVTQEPPGPPGERRKAREGGSLCEEKQAKALTSPERRGGGSSRAQDTGAVRAGRRGGAEDSGRRAALCTRCVRLRSAFGLRRARALLCGGDGGDDGLLQAHPSPPRPQVLLHLLSPRAAPPPAAKQAQANTGYPPPVEPPCLPPFDSCPVRCGHGGGGEERCQREGGRWAKTKWA